MYLDIRRATDFEMENPVILLIMLITLIGATGFVADDVFTKNDSGGLIKEMDQTNYSKRTRSVNVALSVKRNDQLLKSNKKFLHRRQMNNIVREDRSAPEMATGSNHTSPQRRRRSKAKRPLTRGRHGVPVFDAKKHIKRIKEKIPTICERVICDVDYYVKHCVRNYTSDVCTPCPPKTYFGDPTRSEEHAIECRPIPRCSQWPGTVRTQEMHSCAGDLRMPCRCNTDNGICGLDPCSCKKKKCHHDEKLLQNCSCVPKTTTTATVTTSSPTTVSTTASPSTTKSTSTPRDRTLPPTSLFHQVGSTSTSANGKNEDKGGDRTLWNSLPLPLSEPLYPRPPGTLLSLPLNPPPPSGSPLLPSNSSGDPQLRLEAPLWRPY